MVSGSISGSVDKVDTELLSPWCALLLFTMEQATKGIINVSDCWSKHSKGWSM